MSDAGVIAPDAVEALAARVSAAAEVGMQPAVWAALQPDRVAIYDYTGQDRTFGALNANANRVARLLRGAGLQAGDSVALACSNRAEFCDVLFGVLRAGMRCTPVNWHLTGDEIAYIVQDCEAKAFFADARIAKAAESAAAQCPNLVLKVAIGGPVAGFQDYDAALAALDGSDIADPVRGYTMLYTSGTTGRPKGVFKPGVVYGAFQPEADREHDIYLCTGPAYHAAPLAFDVRSSMVMGVPLVFLDRWDSEGVLKTIQDYKVTRAHLVPIMFQRLLNLPEDVRKKYDVSSLRYIIHGAAPCPPEVKKAMIDWVGPIINEYYAGSEGGAGFVVSSEEWLKKPGTVGKLPDPTALRILDDDGHDVPQGVSGTLYFKVSPIAPFEYYKDPDKTAAAHREGYFTLGDVGYLDEDGYLFLTGRTAECIISGGVNIYPQEIDNELIKHPAVEDACTIGVPNEEWGEEVKSVLTLNPGYVGTDALAADIQKFAREHLAGFKAPRTIEFVEELPRSPAGKIQRKKVREPYWAGRARAI